mmetsp:Transcript_11961/g.27972  ORF Transcript_11961/g.27972 Transcript_11961/m.27972 type:complete len:232 (+) Transcript_11961:119-814(+)
MLSGVCSLPSLPCAHAGGGEASAWHQPMRSQKDRGGNIPCMLPPQNALSAHARPASSGGHNPPMLPRRQHSFKRYPTTSEAPDHLQGPHPLSERCAEAAKVFQSYGYVEKRAHSTEVLMKGMRKPTRSVHGVHSVPWLASVERMRDAEVRRSTGSDPRPVPSWNFRSGGASGKARAGSRGQGRCSARRCPKGRRQVTMPSHQGGEHEEAEPKKSHPLSDDAKEMCSPEELQ